MLKKADGWMYYPRMLRKKNNRISECAGIGKGSPVDLINPFMQPLYVDLQEDGIISCHNPYILGFKKTGGQLFKRRIFNYLRIYRL